MSRRELPSKAEENLAYYRSVYRDEIERGREPWEFGMKWLQHQIDEWQVAVNKELES